MANKKINELDSRASLSLSDLLAVGDPTTGYLYKITITDLKTLTGAGVISFNGRVGSVTPAEGDYSLNQLSDVIITSATNGNILKYNGSNWVNVPMYTGTIAQYVDGTGAYQTFPTLLSSDRLVTEVRNTTGATVTKGTVIYLSGSSGTLPTIAKAQANSEATSSSTYGVVQNDIANNANGYVVVIGNLTGIDTSAFNAGDVLWLSPTVAGGVTTTKPSAPNNSVYIGIVTRSNNTAGTIEVKIQNGYELDELHNVAISSVANNEVLVYESSTTLWKNKSIATILGYTPISLSSLSASAPLSYNSGTGAFTISQASGSTDGYLSSTDWNTFNSKQNALTNPVTGTGTSGHVTYFTGSTSVAGSANHFWDATNNRLGIGLTNPQRSLEIYSATADSHLRLSGAAPSVSMGEAITGAVYQAKFGLATASNQYITGSVAGDFVIISQTASTIWFNNGAERMRVTGSGNVGIGLTAPASKLDVLQELRVSFANANQYRVRITNTDGNGRLFVDGDESALLFGTSPAGTNATATEKMRISSNGNVGIGTTSPSNKLAIYDTADVWLSVTKSSVFNNIGIDSVGAFYNTNSNHTFYVNNGTITALKISSAGNVGIGTASPSNLLHISSTSGALLKIQGSSTGNNTNSIQGVNGSGDTFELGIANAGYSNAIYPGIQAKGSYLYGSITLGLIAENGPIIFQTAYSERMRISNGGNVLINKTSNTSASISTSGSLQVNNEIMATGSLGGLFWENRSGGVTTNSNWYGWYTTSGTIYLFNGSANIASINSSTGAYTALSDINKKKDFEDSKIGLDAVLGLKPTLYRMKGEDKSTKKHLGFIAQEVKEFIPQAYIQTKGEKDDFIGLDDRPIIAALVKAIQEQQAQIEQLKTQIK